MISIAMTTYNGERYIERQLNTILNQSLPVDEIVICDDCSQDRTVEVVERIIAATQDIRIRLIQNEENLGYVRNFYKAISLTHGDYIFLSDQDDEWHFDKVAKMIQTMEETKASAICTDCRFIDEDSKEIPNTAYYDRNPFIHNVTQRLTPITFYELVIGNIAQGCTYCFTEAVKQSYLRVNSSHLIHDHQIMFVASLLGNVYFLNEALIDYRLHSQNMVGFGSAEDGRKLKLKFPSAKPVMVRFMEDLGRAVDVPNLEYYKLLYYCRIPYFISVFRRKQYSKYSRSEKEIK